MKWNDTSYTHSSGGLDETRLDSRREDEMRSWRRKEGHTWIHSFVHSSTHEQATMQCTGMTWSEKYMALSDLIRVWLDPSIKHPVIRIWSNALNWIDVDRAYVIGFHVSFSSHFIRWDRNGHLHGSWSGLLSYPAAAVAISWNHSNHWSIHLHCGSFGWFGFILPLELHETCVCCLLFRDPSLSLSSHLFPSPLLRYLLYYCHQCQYQYIHRFAIHTHTQPSALCSQ